MGQTVHTTPALLLRRVEYAEADLILTLFTQEFGKVSALARLARKSQRRFGGKLEPLHTLLVDLEARPRSELQMLRTAQIAKFRTGILQTLEKLEAAGRFLGWVMRALPPHTPEPEVWLLLNQLLDDLSDANERPPELILAESGLYFLVLLGWGLDFERCVHCSKVCPHEQAALINPIRGGLVCRSCGGARFLLDGSTRLRLAEAARGSRGVLTPADAKPALELLEQVLKAHAGIE